MELSSSFSIDLKSFYSNKCTILFKVTEHHYILDITFNVKDSYQNSDLIKYYDYLFIAVYKDSHLAFKKLENDFFDYFNLYSTILNEPLFKLLKNKISLELLLMEAIL